MLEITGLDLLLKVVRETGIKPTKLAIHSIIQKPRHGVWVVKDGINCIGQGYGIDTLVDYNLDHAEALTDKNDYRFIGLTAGQHNTVVFGVTYEDEEDMISVRTVLSGGKVPIAVVEHKPLVSINPIVENNDDDVINELSEQDSTELSVGDGERGDSEGNGESGDSEGTNSGDTESTSENETIDEGTSEGDTAETKNVESDLNPEIKPNFEYAGSLSKTGNKNEQKVALEDYARKFGVELSRGKKFEAMIVDSKEATNV